MSHHDCQNSEFNFPAQEFPVTLEKDFLPSEDTFSKNPEEAPEDSVPGPEITEPGAFRTSFRRSSKKMIRNFAFFTAASLVTLLTLGPLKPVLHGTSGQGGYDGPSGSGYAQPGSQGEPQLSVLSVSRDAGIVYYSYSLMPNEAEYPLELTASVMDTNGGTLLSSDSPRLFNGPVYENSGEIDVSGLTDPMMLELKVSFTKDGVQNVVSSKMRVPEAEPDENGEHADDAFPVLMNLEPNGVIPGYGVLDEEYILINDESVLFAGAKYSNPAETVSGASYDAASNTLTLNNFTGTHIEANLMGNGFTINLIGDNHVGNLLVWGFMYGGSVKFTGSGSLSVNESMQYTHGIIMEAESSQTCIMIDKNVTLDIHGTEAAVMVFDTNMEKAIYYLAPLKLSGGIRAAIEKDEGEFHDYSVLDEDGNPSTHVRFGR